MSLSQQSTDAIVLFLCVLPVNNLAQAAYLCIYGFAT